MTKIITARPANFTRRSESLVAKFVRERRFHFIPLYWILRLSDFAREGIEHSGSYRFADHLYRNVPSGRGWIGRRLDALLLKLPAARSMRQRCFASRDAMRRAFDAHAKTAGSEPFHILTIPCGLPRDVRDFADTLSGSDTEAAREVRYTGIDIDPEVVWAASAFLAGSAVTAPTLRVGNALDPADFPQERPHFIASTGLGEFLSDADLASFYRNVFDALPPGGVFFTSAAARGRGSDVLLRAFELDIHYRAQDQISAILGKLPWRTIEIATDKVGLQTFLFATKP